MRKQLLAVLLLTSTLTGGFIYATWDTTTPLGSEAKSLGDDRIREFKTDIQTALRASGNFPGNDTASPRFLIKLATGTTAQRPTGNDVSTGSWRVNTSSNVIEIYNGSAWSAVDVIPSSGVTATKIDGSVAGNGLTGGGGTALAVNVDTTHFTISGDSVTFVGGASNFQASAVLQSGVTGDSTRYVLQFTDEIYDAGAEFNAVSTFTANAAGKYHFDVQVRFQDIASGHTGCELRLVVTGGTNRSYVERQTFTTANPYSVMTLRISVDVDLSAGDTVIADLLVSGGAKNIDVVDDGVGTSSVYTFFGGHRLR